VKACHRAPRHSNSLTKADLAAQKAENLIHRDFTADTPNRKWLTDITQIQCQDGKLYLAAVLDCDLNPKNFVNRNVSHDMLQ
jgi:transposase InsO family protein